MDAMLAALVRGDQVDWPFTGAAAERQFLDAAREHGVVPLVAWQQRRLGSLNNWPATLRERHCDARATARDRRAASAVPS